MIAGTAAAQQAQGSGTEGGRTELPGYSTPPFPRQSQEWPGLTGEMEPVPDHGEEICQGNGSLAGHKTLITGGDSESGRAAAIACAREGADVAINSLPEEQPDAVEQLGGLDILVNNAVSQEWQPSIPEISTGG